MKSSKAKTTHWWSNTSLRTRCPDSRQRGIEVGSSLLTSAITSGLAIDYKAYGYRLAGGPAPVSDWSHRR